MHTNNCAEMVNNKVFVNMTVLVYRTNINSFQPEMDRNYKTETLDNKLLTVSLTNISNRIIFPLIV